MASFSVQWTARVKSNNYDQTDLLLSSAPGSTDKLEISASVYSLYVYGSWTFTSQRALMESGRLAVGNIIHFDFFPDDGKVYGYDLAILSFRNGPGSNASFLGETYQITLVSPWYFDQEIKSKAYNGGTANIIKQLIKEDLPNSFSKYSMITETTDSRLTTRYRTIQTAGRFIEDRLMSNIRGVDNTTPLIYTNLKNEFELIDMTSIQNTQNYVAVSLKSDNIASYQAQLNDANLSRYFVFPQAMVFNVNNGPSKQLWHLTNPGMLYLYHTDGTVNTVNDLPVLQPLTHDVANPYTLVSATKRKGILTKIYNDDSFNNYGDILSEIINAYSKDLLDNFSINLVCYPNMNMDVGRHCFLDLLDPEAGVASRFSQLYLIRTVSHIFTGFQATTHVELTTTALSYTDPNTVKNLFHL